MSRGGPQRVAPEIPHLGRCRGQEPACYSACVQLPFKELACVMPQSTLAVPWSTNENGLSIVCRYLSLTSCFSPTCIAGCMCSYIKASTDTKITAWLASADQLATEDGTLTWPPGFSQHSSSKLTYGTASGGRRCSTATVRDYLSEDMCGRARCALSREEVASTSGVPPERWQDAEKYQPGHNMSPGHWSPVVKLDQDGQHQLQSMKSGPICMAA